MAARATERAGDQRRWSWDQYETVVLRRWSRSRVAVLEWRARIIAIERARPTTGRRGPPDERRFPQALPVA